MIPKVRLEHLNYNDPDQIGWIYKIRTHPEIVGYFFAPPPKTFVDHVQFLAKCAESKQRQFLIVYANNQPCGYCQIICHPDNYEIGLALHPLWWGKGVGSICVELLLEYIYIHLLTEKTITLQVRKDNARALHLYKKYGFNIVKKIDKEDGYLMELCDVAQKL